MHVRAPPSSLQQQQTQSNTSSSSKHTWLPFFFCILCFLIVALFATDAVGSQWQWAATTVPIRGLTSDSNVSNPKFNTPPCKCEGNEGNTNVATSTRVPPRQRFIFIDAGANTGDTFEQFLRGGFFPKYVDRHSSEAYLFEANPVFRERLHALQRNYSHIIKGVYEAMWFEDANLTIFLDTINEHTPQPFWGTSIHKSHYDIVASNFTHITVEAKGLCDFLLNTVKAKGGAKDEFGVTRGDYVHIKMDIEGAEYAIFDHFFENKPCVDAVSEVTIEFHWRMLSRAEKDEHIKWDSHDLAIIENFGKHGIEYHRWKRR
eukprot:CAMPEP_0202713312 /NCGR_PEP_ID=MMETSP1385-20130828/52495_1 /ASSEMBLY_ACC=CAM_ASM_000861 /TAXON_ID=933848 /ORGANISM="Elphidium margaritaceum" /LENGTH=316 /DNA_ID=CAMNT_0049373615 /DNA_START=24 /DNA_END=974 /DNA_ORIENTATION=+